MGLYGIAVGRTSAHGAEVTFCLWREIQKLVAFLVVFLGAYLCQILKEMNMIGLVSFAFFGSSPDMKASSF